MPGLYNVLYDICGLSHFGIISILKKIKMKDVRITLMRYILLSLFWKANCKMGSAVSPFRQWRAHKNGVRFNTAYYNSAGETKTPMNK